MRLLELRIGVLSKRAEAGVRRLSLKQVESLGEALLSFTSPRDLAWWLREHASNSVKKNGRKTRRG